jgi:hypothetical protein
MFPHLIPYSLGEVCTVYVYGERYTASHTGVNFASRLSLNLRNNNVSSDAKLPACMGNIASPFKTTENGQKITEKFSARYIMFVICTHISTTI